MESQNCCGIVAVALWTRSSSDGYEQIGRHVGGRHKHYPCPHRTLGRGSRCGSYIQTSRKIRKGKHLQARADAGDSAACFLKLLEKITIAWHWALGLTIAEIWLNN